jgi:hypothetical protein
MSEKFEYLQGVLDGKLLERERVVKLLKAAQCIDDCPNHPAECYPSIHGLEVYIHLIEMQDK